MENFLLIVVLLFILGGAIAYVVKAKKNGVKCIGCPTGAACGKKDNPGDDCSGNCSSCLGCEQSK